ncbi:hypothetical protein Tco_0016159 [Tanacetum coccineum]
MPTEMELTLEQTQQGVSYEVSVDPHGFKGTCKDGDGADTIESSLELDLLFSPMYEEYFTAAYLIVSKSSDLSDNLQQQGTQPTLNVQPKLELITYTPNVNADETNTDQATDA